MSKLKKRMVLDLLLTIMLAFEMFYQFTGNALHEYVGFAFFVGVAVHLLLSRQWISSTASQVGKKKMNRRRKGLTVMALLLFVDLVVLAFSSVVISNTLWSLGVNLSALNPSGIWVLAHNASAYGLCVLALVHLAMHWVQVAGVLKVEYDPSRRRAIGQCVGAVVGISAVALGVVGARQVGESAAASVASAMGLEPNEEFGIVNDAGVQESAGQSSSAVSSAASTDSSTNANAGENAGESSSSGSSARKGKGRGKRNVQNNAVSDADDATSRSQQDSASSELSAQELGSESGSGTGDADEFGYDSGSESGDIYGNEFGSESGSNSESSTDSGYRLEYESNSGYGSGTESNGSSAYGGICPLCPKRCSLSAPRCNRPYQEGIL